MFPYYYHSTGTPATGWSGGGAAATQADTYDAAVMALTPVAFYKMDEASGTTMVDDSTTGNDGTFANTPTLGETGPFAGATGVTFDGTNWATAPYTSALDLGTADFSIVLWVKRSTQSPDDQWMLQRSDGDDALELATWYEDENEIGMRFTSADGLTTSWRRSNGSYALDDGSWHMLAMCADRDGSVAFYVDNVADGTGVISDRQYSLNGSYTLYVARRSVAGAEWVGTMSRLSIFASLLSATDIGDLWTAAGGA